MERKDKISATMSMVKSQNTSPERKIKSALVELGFAVIENNSSLPGKPDIVLPEERVIIFVDGDFWHGNQWRLRGLSSLDDQFQESQNKDYWISKIERNVIRDSRVTYELLETGWLVIRLWESQIETDLNSCVQYIVSEIKARTKQTLLARLSMKTVAEFFAGIGLMRMGLERKGWKVLFANDFDPDKVEMYFANFPAETGVMSEEDIHLLAVDKMPEVTLATASFPCNDLSLAGGRMGLNEGKQSSAFWGFIRVLQESRERRPPLVLLENVVGFLTSKNGEEFNQALLTLNELDYYVDAFILDAANFVPQSRKRLFIIGIHESLQSGLNPLSTILNGSNARPKLLENFILQHSGIKWAIWPLPDQPQPKIGLENILEDLSLDSPEWWTKDRAEYLLNQMSPKHREIANQMIVGDNWRYGTVFRRVRNGKTMAEMRTDGVAGCLRTPRGGSGRQILFMAGKGQYFVRLLTPRECARLMGADNYNITVNLNQALFGFGDAVCVPVIEWIAEYYLNPLINELIHQFNPDGKDDVK